MKENKNPSVSTTFQSIQKKMNAWLSDSKDRAFFHGAKFRLQVTPQASVSQRNGTEETVHSAGLIKGTKEIMSVSVEQSNRKVYCLHC